MCVLKQQQLPCTYVCTCIRTEVVSLTHSLIFSCNLFCSPFSMIIILSNILRSHNFHSILQSSSTLIFLQSILFLVSFFLPSFLNSQQSHHFSPHFLPSFLLILPLFFVHFHKLCVCALFVDFNDFVIAKCQTVKNTEILVSILVEYFSIHS